MASNAFFICNRYDANDIHHHHYARDYFASFGSAPVGTQTSFAQQNEQVIKRLGAILTMRPDDIPLSRTF